VSGTNYLAAVEESSQWRPTSECLVLFLTGGDEPETCLLDPAVISVRPASGHWCLVYFDPERAQAFYSHFDRTDSPLCAVHGMRYAA
jgi:hypothetical protein